MNDRTSRVVIPNGADTMKSNILPYLIQRGMLLIEGANVRINDPSADSPSWSRLSLAPATLSRTIDLPVRMLPENGRGGRRMDTKRILLTTSILTGL